MIELHPGLILIIGAIIAVALPLKIRQVVIIASSLLAIYALFRLNYGIAMVYPFINEMELILLKVDKLSWVFGLIFTIMAFLGCLFGLHVKNRIESASAMVYAGSALGVTFAGDWFSLLIFWELMAISSVFLIWYRKTLQSTKAGMRYFIFHLLGGNLLLAGILLLILNGNYEVGLLTGNNDAAFWLVFLGVAINAAIVPLHAWLSDAYPEGTVTGSVFLSSFTTKVAVYALVRIFAGFEVLIWLGVLMALYGVVYAVLENNIRRLLAYHIISQVGYMVAGVGIGTSLALNGAVAHAFCHILYKSLLFMGTGSVIYMTGKEKLSELGGIARKMPLVVILYMVGAFSISGVPLFNGFISKSMVVSAAGAADLPVAELLLLMASIGTFLHTGLKLPYFTFFGENKGAKVERSLPLNMYLAMAGGAFLCILLGIFPSLLYQYLPFAATYHPWTADHVLAQLQLLFGTLIAFYIYIPKLGGKPTVSLDVDWLYRKPGLVFINGLTKITCEIRDYLRQKVGDFVMSLKPFADNPFAVITKTTPVSAEKGAIGYYNEDRYRFSTGTLITLFIAVFVFMVSYLLILFS